MWLPWQPAAVIGAVLALAGWVLPVGVVRSTNRAAVTIGAVWFGVPLSRRRTLERQRRLRT